jgi:hypothetical protein
MLSANAIVQSGNVLIGPVPDHIHQWLSGTYEEESK